MSFEQFRNRVTSSEGLAALIGSPSRLVIRKQLNELDDPMKTIVAENVIALLRKNAHRPNKHRGQNGGIIEPTNR